jgi:ribosomal protein S18 acetylase RimI-like enzyme
VAAADISVEILDLRHFSASDLRRLLEEETRVWEQLLAWDYHGSADMILRYIDAKILPGYAAVEHGRVAGYSFFVYEGSKGVIGDLFVCGQNGAPERPRTRISPPSSWEGNANQYALEKRLLRHVIETLQQSPGIHRVEAQLLVHEAGAVAGPFLEQGFRRYPRLFMVLPLTKTAEDPISLPPGLEMRPWDEQDYHGVATVITGAYKGHIDADINDQYRTMAGSLRFLNNIVRFPGCGVFDADSSFVVLHKATRLMVGAILCSRVKDDVGHVTQVCVLPEQRGRGVGQALLAASASALRRRKFSLLTLTVTEANAPAVQIYRKLGYTTRRVFDAFVWEG